MRHAMLGLSLALALGALALGAPAIAQGQQSTIAASLADPSRPPADRARDASRKPGALLAFAGVRRGMWVLELDPGRGYFTRALSLAVGPPGLVLAYVPEESVSAPYKPLDAITAVAAEPGRGNVRVMHDPLLAPAWPDLAGNIDLVWTSQNYHDFHNIAGFDGAAFNARMFALLKPGGVYLVTDHAALPGAGVEVTHTLHRIDKALVIAEVEAAGFVLDGESAALANPADPHTQPVFDPAIRGATDQFVLRFRKPRREHHG